MLLARTIWRFVVKTTILNWHPTLAEFPKRSIASLTNHLICSRRYVIILPSLLREKAFFFFRDVCNRSHGSRQVILTLFRLPSSALSGLWLLPTTIEHFERDCLLRSEFIDLAVMPTLNCPNAAIASFPAWMQPIPSNTQLGSSAKVIIRHTRSLALSASTPCAGLVCLTTSWWFEIPFKYLEAFASLSFANEFHSGI